jgi:hypothetical protein
VSGRGRTSGTSSRYRRHRTPQQRGRIATAYPLSPCGADVPERGHVTVTELLGYAGVLLALLAVQLVLVQLTHVTRNAWRRLRGRPPVDTDPKVDPLTWGRLTRRGRRDDLAAWEPVGDPDRFLRSRRRSRPPDE